MDPEADLGLLEHVRGRIARIGRAHQRGKMTVLRLPLGAGRRNTQTIAKSTQRLTDGIRAIEPEVPWRAIAGSRNVLLHGYFEIDLEVVWSWWMKTHQYWLLQSTGWRTPHVVASRKGD